MIRAQARVPRVGAREGLRNTTGPAITVREVTTVEGFDGLRSAWDRVAGCMELQSPFLDWEWSRSWWDAFGAGNRLAILAFEAEGEVVGVAQFQERRHRLGPLQVSSLVGIGWEDGGNQPVTEHLELLFPPDHRAALQAALERWLCRRAWSVAWLPNLAEDEALPRWMAGHVVARSPVVPYHHRPLPVSWEDLVSGLNKSMRDNVKYYPRLMVRHGHEFTFEVAATPRELEPAFSLLVDLHRRRAAVTSGVPHFDYLRFEARREFVRRMVLRLASQDEARIGILRVRGEALAAYLWLERNDTMFFYRSGYDPEWSKYSVALVVALEALKDGMRRGISQVEFLRGGGQLKERWDTEVRARRHLMLARAPRIVRPLLSARAARRSLTYEVV